MTFTEREYQRRTRTASEERRAILWIVIVGVTVQCLEVLIALAVLKAVFDAASNR